MPINSRTGLLETPHSRFRAPVIHQRSLEELQLDSGHPTAIHTVPIEHVKSLDFYSRIGKSDTLHVSLQGAVTPGKVRYPNFPRVTSMRKRSAAFMAIPDPTLQLSDEAAFGLAWYTGNEVWDPLDDIEVIVRKGMELSGATSVMFLGGSGGGHAALRVARRFPGSLAFAMDPQIRIADYSLRHQERLVEECWPGRAPKEVFSEYPERFDLRSLYRDERIVNCIYYRQSTLDHHYEDHALPFFNDVQETSAYKEGKYKFAFEQGEKPGHGSITDGEFARHLEAARRHWHQCT